MESKGKYWIPICNILETAVTNTLAHPKYMKAIHRKETDKKDTQWINLVKKDLVAGNFMLHRRFANNVTRCATVFKLTNFTSGEKNRFQNSLTVSNTQIASVVGDTFGKRYVKNYK